MGDNYTFLGFCSAKEKRWSVNPILEGEKKYHSEIILQWNFYLCIWIVSYRAALWWGGGPFNRPGPPLVSILWADQFYVFRQMWCMGHNYTVILFCFFCSEKEKRVWSCGGTSVCASEQYPNITAQWSGGSELFSWPVVHCWWVFYELVKFITLDKCWMAWNSQQFLPFATSIKGSSSMVIQTSNRAVPCHWEGGGQAVHHWWVIYKLARFLF